MSVSHTPGAFSRRHLIRAGAAGATLAAIPTIGRAQQPTLRIGQIEALSGPSGAFGLRSSKGAQFRVDDINASGGVKIGATTYKLALTSQDMANDARQAITLFRQYASDSDFIAGIGPTNSVGFLPIVPIAEQVKFPVVGTGSAGPVKTWNTWVFRVNPVNQTGTPVLIKRMVARDKIKTMAAIYDQTQQSQADDASIYRDMAPQFGYTMARFEAFRSGDQDFSAQIASIRAARPDAIFIGAAVTDGVKIVSQLREAGMEQRLVSGLSIQDPAFWDGCKGLSKGSYSWIAFDLQSPGPEMKAFQEQYKAKFNEDLTSVSAYGSDAISAIVAAMQQAGSIDREAIRAHLASLDIVTPTGAHVKFTNPPTGENQTPTAVPVMITGRTSYETF
jgi:branched-chain amino acid transport system substrate-binding protein